MEPIHISDTHPRSSRMSRGLCGERGMLSGYDPTVATCDECLEKFKEKFPEAWDMWQQVHNGSNAEAEE